MLQVNKSLTHLDLSANSSLSDSGARYIFEGLHHNNTLLYLNLSRTDITVTDPRTAISLTEMLIRNKCLAHLDLSCNIYAHEMISCILEELEHITALSF